MLEESAEYSDPHSVVKAVRVGARRRRAAGPAGWPGAHREGSPAAAAGEPSPREQEVLRLLVQGGYKQIAGPWPAITERTVKSHLTTVFQRIGVINRVQAALWSKQTRRRRSADRLCCPGATSRKDPPTGSVPSNPVIGRMEEGEPDWKGPTTPTTGYWMTLPNIALVAHDNKKVDLLSGQSSTCPRCASTPLRDRHDRHPARSTSSASRSLGS